ncbi:hypothetical protein GOBAR_AA26830 [Gossypium barbadense]|uniref:Uncharacterized protein n=1 Tax=Gossypium barbadense TaxID=3634 RepID=A0A2P5WRY4_GOSBA|nr:hypothetical protein GOBAR_AA26830 [Gossypium barbadense]
MEAGHVFFEYVRDAMVANRRMARSMNAEVYSRCNETFRVTETTVVNPVYHLGPTELISEVDVYTLEHMFRVWENGFPVLPDLSTWEVPPMTFDLVLDKGLRRNLKGRL